MTATQLYTKEGTKLNPTTTATAVKVDKTKTSIIFDNVQQCLEHIFTQIGEDLNIPDLLDNIIFDIKYKRSKTDNVEDVKGTEDWGDVYDIPNSEFPYTWKRTIIKYLGSKEGEEKNIFYEIVSADISTEIQNIYRAPSPGEDVVIEYPKVQGGDKEEDDLDAFDNKLPEGWSEIPISISQANPMVYISTRKRVKGKWQRYSNPAVFGRWAFDSKLELRYATTPTQTPPKINITLDNPGQDWKTDAITSFTGYLWMITATSVNGVISHGSDEVRWQGPYLMAIVK